MDLGDDVETDPLLFCQTANRDSCADGMFAATEPAENAERGAQIRGFTDKFPIERDEGIRSEHNRGGVEICY